MSKTATSEDRERTEAVRLPLCVRDDHPNRACLTIHDANGHTVAVIYYVYGDKPDRDADGIWRGDANRIRLANMLVNAVNSYDDLKAENERLREALKGIVEGHRDCVALSKAGGTE